VKITENSKQIKGKDLKDRFYSFALRIVNFIKSLPKNWIALEIGKQLLHSGTSIAANYEEACGAFSKEDFIYKINTALKEARESNYWLRLIKDTKIASGDELNRLVHESEEISKILGQSVKTARENVNV
jgi:four helix bundle protein